MLLVAGLPVLPSTLVDGLAPAIKTLGPQRWSAIETGRAVVVGLACLAYADVEGLVSEQADRLTLKRAAIRVLLAFAAVRALSLITTGAGGDAVLVSGAYPGTEFIHADPAFARKNVPFVRVLVTWCTKTAITPRRAASQGPLSLGRHGCAVFAFCRTIRVGLAGCIRTLRQAYTALLPSHTFRALRAALTRLCLVRGRGLLLGLGTTLGALVLPARPVPALVIQTCWPIGVLVVTI